MKDHNGEKLGATHAVKIGGFMDAVLDNYPDGVVIVSDPMGGVRFTDSIRALKPFGQLQVLGATDGDIPAVKVNRLLLKTSRWWASLEVQPRLLIHTLFGSNGPS